MNIKFKELIEDFINDIVENCVELVEAENIENYEEANTINSSIDATIKFYGEYLDTIMPNTKTQFIELMELQKLNLIKSIKENQHFFINN